MQLQESCDSRDLRFNIKGRSQWRDQYLLCRAIQNTNEYLMLRKCFKDHFVLFSLPCVYQHSQPLFSAHTRNPCFMYETRAAWVHKNICLKHVWASGTFLLFFFLKVPWLISNGYKIHKVITATLSRQLCSSSPDWDFDFEQTMGQDILRKSKKKKIRLYGEILQNGLKVNQARKWTGRQRCCAAGAAWSADRGTKNAMNSCRGGIWSGANHCFKKCSGIRTCSFSLHCHDTMSSLWCFLCGQQWGAWWEKVRILKVMKGPP